MGQDAAAQERWPLVRQMRRRLGPADRIGIHSQGSGQRTADPWRAVTVPVEDAEHGARIDAGAGGQLGDGDRARRGAPLTSIVGRWGRAWATSVSICPLACPSSNFPGHENAPGTCCTQGELWSSLRRTSLAPERTDGQIPGTDASYAVSPAGLHPHSESRTRAVAHSRSELHALADDWKRACLPRDFRTDNGPRQVDFAMGRVHCCAAILADRLEVFGSVHFCPAPGLGI
jgi:hypothetical protein